MPRLVDKHLTDAAVRKAAPAASRYDLYDAKLRGFGLRVAISGTKTWFVMRRVNGRMVRAKVGRYPEVSLAQARDKAAGMLALMAEGEHPRGVEGLDFGSVLAEWLERDQGKNRSVDDVRSALAKHVTPRLTGRALDSIRKHDVLRILDKIADGGAPVQANRVLAYLRRFFNCVSSGISWRAILPLGSRRPARRSAGSGYLLRTSSAPSPIQARASDIRLAPW